MSPARTMEAYASVKGCIGALLHVSMRHDILCVLPLTEGGTGTAQIVLRLGLEWHAGTGPRRAESHNTGHQARAGLSQGVGETSIRARSAFSFFSRSAGSSYFPRSY